MAMLTALVETYGEELKVGKKEIGEYLKQWNIDVQSPSFPFKTLEPFTCLMIIAQTQKIKEDNLIHLGYWTGNADVPSIPMVFIGEKECIPADMRRGLTALFCVQLKNIESVLKPFANAVSALEKTLKTASNLQVDGRIALRDELIRETIKAMESVGYNMEEYKEKL